MTRVDRSSGDGRLRIAHVVSTPSGIGGAEKVIGALVERGRDNGWDQTVIHPFAEDPGESALASLVAGATYRARPLHGYAGLPLLRSWVRRRIADADPHIVHTHLFHALVLVGSLRKASHRRWILTHHHGDLLHQSGRRRDEFLDRVMGRRFPEIVAVSEAVRGFLVEHYGFPASQIDVIRNGWEGKPIADPKKADRPTIVTVGNLRVEKGQSVLLLAFADVVKEIPAARLQVIGSGPLVSELQSLSDGLGLGPSVDFMGSVADVWPYLGAAHVFAFPSLLEPLGMAVQEAMAAGLPVVASGVGGITELIEDRVTGVLVPPGDAVALASTLIELLRSQELRNELGHRARDAAASMTLESTIDRYESLYRMGPRRPDRLTRPGPPPGGG